MFDKTSDSIKINFVKYLENLGISPKSHKNYRSDLNHFTGWLILKVRSFGSYIESLSDGIPFLNKNLSQEYKSFLLENKIPVKTINRRLSTLRHLSRFLTFSNLSGSGFMDGIENISLGKNDRVLPDSVLQSFQAYLETEKVSKNTVKNYVSDVRHFLSWLESNQVINQPVN